MIKDAEGNITELHCTYDPASKGGNSPDGRKVKGTIHWVSAQHDDYTDVITFDYTEGDKISGDIFISYERIIENAAGLDISPENELLRVMIHGILHLCGYKDKNPIAKKEMTEKENKNLAFYPGI